MSKRAPGRHTMAEEPTSASRPRGGSERIGGDGSSPLSALYRLAGVGVELVVGVVLFGGIGWWLDGKWNTRPWLMISGGAVGFAAGLWRLFRIARKSFRD